MPDAHAAAAEARHNPALRAVARAGFVAVGCVHILIGVIAIVLAFGGRADSDQSGALAAIAGAPLGVAGLWIIAVALWALAVWMIADGLMASTHGDAERRAKGWGRRLTAWGRGVAYAAVGAGAASVALGARRDSDESAQSASRDLLHVPGGPIVLGLIGLVVAGVGVGFVVNAITRGFTKRMTIPDTRTGNAVTALGVIGYVAEGVALLLVGLLLVVAAVTVDPERAGGTDAALKALLEKPVGPWAVGAIGVGLIAYGLFSALRAKYDRV